MLARPTQIYTKREVDALLRNISGFSGGNADLSQIAAASGSWNLTTSQFNISSPLWNEVYTQVQTQSASWLGGGSDVSNLSGNWENTYTTVKQYSAAWLLSGTDVDLGQVPYLTGNWNSVYSVVNSNSSNWDSTYNTLYVNSGIWIDNINYLSGEIDNVNTDLYNVSSTIITIITATSSILLSNITDIQTNITNISLVSGNWNSVHTTVQNNSAGWESTESTLYTNSGAWINNINYLSAQIISVSSSLYTTIYNVSTNLEAMIDSVSASIQSLTGQYEASFLTTDWVGASAPYTITILPATHYQGATKDLNVTVKEDLGSENQIVYDSPSINDNGTVTLSTNTKYNGSVIIGKLGGFTATDVTNAKKGQITCVFDGLGTVLATGLKAYVLIENNATIQGWTATGDGNTGSIVVDVWKCPYASFPPTVANTIAGSEKPTITSAKTGQDTNLTTWTTQINAGDYIGFNVDSCSTFTKASITLKISK